MHGRQETICVAWCDNGFTDGAFTQKLAELMLNGEQMGIPIGGMIRNVGNQIARQRHQVIANWYNAKEHEWLLCIDSDIEADIQSVKELWNIADFNTRPIVSGIYYVIYEREQTTPEPVPAIFSFDTETTVVPINIEEQTEVFKADAAGFGLLLIHRSVIDNLIKQLGTNTSFFFETYFNNHFVGEDIIFFSNVKKCNIPLYVTKKAMVQHIKRFSVGIEYYNLYQEKPL
jgi:hypothetical protein